MSLVDLLYWFGGKRPLRKQIIPFLIPLIGDVNEYREPFCGSAAMALSLMSLHPGQIYQVHLLD
jgi:site-specific DNA-adenine methylase